MSNKFQPWSEIEDETLLQELETLPLTFPYLNIFYS